jgi:uncharacterized RDD family membrane protein YckC
MMNDTVREELETKIVRPEVPRISKAELPKFEPIKPWVPQPVKLNQEAPDVVARPPVRPTPSEPVRAVMPAPTPPANEPLKTTASVPVPQPELPKPKVVTAKLKKQTSPTLVDFQPSNPTMPDWRLQLQNSIRKRNLEPKSQLAQMTVPEVAIVARAAAPAPLKDPSIAAMVQSEKLANAIQRIEVSKRTFGSGAAVGMAAAAQARRRKPAAPQRSFPFDVVERTAKADTVGTPVTSAPAMPKPTLVTPMAVEKKKFDTNKLPPLPEPEKLLPEDLSEQVEELATEIPRKISFERLRIWTTSPKEESNNSDGDTEGEIDDIPPFSMRFGAAVFDLIIGSFACGILLSPLLLSEFFVSTVGLLTIFGGWLAVMFAYFTGSIVYTGRTFGMRLFSIEMIDAEANELPTFHQAAVNSAVYLISLMLLGLGFVPAFFNEERRAVHDLLAGTLLIREY